MDSIKHIPNRKAKKVHYCNLCHSKIEIGEEYDYQFNSDGGDSWESKSHKKCLQLAINLDADNGEGYTDEALSDCICDELRNFIKDDAEYDRVMELKTCEQVSIVQNFLDKYQARKQAIQGEQV